MIDFSIGQNYSNLFSIYNSMENSSQSIQNSLTESQNGVMGNNSANYSITQQLLFDKNGAHQAIKNAQLGIGLANTALSSVQQVSSILQTMRQLANESANSFFNK